MSISRSSKLGTNTHPIFYTYGISPNQFILVCSRPADRSSSPLSNFVFQNIFIIFAIVSITLIMKEFIKSIFTWLGCIGCLAVPVLAVLGVRTYCLPGISVWEAILFVFTFTIYLIPIIGIIGVAYVKAKDEARSKIGTIILTILYSIVIFMILSIVGHIFDALFPNQEAFEPYRL